MPHDTVCTITNTYPGWFWAIVASIYFFLLLLMFIVYSVILMKFRQSRRRLEQLQKEIKSIEFTSKIVFKKNYRIVSPKSKSDVAGIYSHQIQSISMTMIENETLSLEDPICNTTPLCSDVSCKSSNLCHCYHISYDLGSTYCVSGLQQLYLVQSKPWRIGRFQCNGGKVMFQEYPEGYSLQDHFERKNPN